MLPFYLQVKSIVLLIQSIGFLVGLVLKLVVIILQMTLAIIFVQELINIDIIFIVNSIFDT